MTTFEYLVLFFLFTIIVTIILRSYLIVQEVHNICKPYSRLDSKLQNINDTLNLSVGITDELRNAWACDVTSIVKRVNELTDIVDKMHSNLCVDIADKMVNKMYPVNEGEPLDAAFEPDYKLKKDIECKLNGFAAAVLDAECCPKEILDLWTERICESAHKFIKQFKIDWDKLSKEQQDEFLKRLILPNYDSPFVPPFNPTCEITNNKE